MPDFTLVKYRHLLETLLAAGYDFRTFESYCRGDREGKFVILRHDVDAWPASSYAISLIENELNIRSTYYFRIVKQSNSPEIIEKIAALGHEIGYHYEDFSFARGDIAEAIKSFTANLNYFRRYYPVTTISMHGSPTSRFDNRDLWKRASYRQWDIIGEPYKDVDFDRVTYLTDTGRCWNGRKYSVRDKIGGNQPVDFRSTDDIIRAVNTSALPSQIMLTTHPQRWSDSRWLWWKEYVLQGIKNRIKQGLIRIRKS
jgi:hypothetical protein